MMIYHYIDILDCGIAQLYKINLQLMSVISVCNVSQAEHTLILFHINEQNILREP